MEYYADQGFTGISIDYRLVKEQGQTANFEIIDCYEDCCDALDCIIEHAEDIGVNTSLMFLLGESVVFAC